MPYYEIMSYLVQCNTCQKWYSNQRGLLVHSKYCTERHTSQQDNGNHLFLDHNPLKSCYDQGEHRNPWAIYEDELDELSNSSSKEQEDVGGGGNLTEVDFGGNLSEDDLVDINDEDNQHASYKNKDTLGLSSSYKSD